MRRNSKEMVQVTDKTASRTLHGGTTTTNDEKADDDVDDDHHDDDHDDDRKMSARSDDNNNDNNNDGNNDDDDDNNNIHHHASIVVGSWTKRQHRDFVQAILKIGILYSSPLSLQMEMVHKRPLSSPANNNNEVVIEEEWNNNNNNNNKKKSKNTTTNTTTTNNNNNNNWCEKLKSHLQKFRTSSKREIDVFMNDYDTLMLSLSKMDRWYNNNNTNNNNINNNIKNITFGGSSNNGSTGGWGDLYNSKQQQQQQQRQQHRQQQHYYYIDTQFIQRWMRMDKPLFGGKAAALVSRAVQMDEQRQLLLGKTTTTTTIRKKKKKKLKKMRQEKSMTSNGSESHEIDQSKGGEGENIYNNNNDDDDNGGQSSSTSDEDVEDDEDEDEDEDEDCGISNGINDQKFCRYEEQPSYVLDEDGHPVACIPFPDLTEEEKSTDLGRSMILVMGVLEQMKNFLNEQRQRQQRGNQQVHFREQTLQGRQQKQPPKRKQQQQQLTNTKTVSTFARQKQKQATKKQQHPQESLNPNNRRQGLYQAKKRRRVHIMNEETIQPLDRRKKERDTGFHRRDRINQDQHNDDAPSQTASAGAAALGAASDPLVQARRYSILDSHVSLNPTSASSLSYSNELPHGAAASLTSLGGGLSDPMLTSDGLWPRHFAETAATAAATAAAASRGDSSSVFRNQLNDWTNHGGGLLMDPPLQFLASSSYDSYNPGYGLQPPATLLSNWTHVQNQQQHQSRFHLSPPSASEMMARQAATLTSAPAISGSVHFTLPTHHNRFDAVNPSSSLISFPTTTESGTVRFAQQHQQQQGHPPF